MTQLVGSVYGISVSKMKCNQSHVAAPPRIITLDNNTGSEGGSTVLICVTEGYPPATMTFQKAGKLPYATGANVSYHQLSNIRNTKSHNLNVSYLVLQLSLHNPFHSSPDP